MAVIYIRNRKDTLMTYLEDGRCSLGNNALENSLRPVTLGRKNWLFNDSQEGANASIVVYTMVEMAKAHGFPRITT
ncbi:IS66 family transposase [Hungatella hathewayi]|uniref:IS66 family transposase n=1 Tax=Hungatella hathewayi TaxID=154046 RepID=UPI003D810580